MGTEIELTSGILSLLGIVSKHGRLTAGQHVGTKMFDFAKPKELRVYLDQINTTSNYVNGVPSSLLTIIPVSDKSFSRAVYLSFALPAFIQLINGCITEFSFKIRDKNDITIDNHGLPILVELVIQ